MVEPPLSDALRSQIRDEAHAIRKRAAFLSYAHYKSTFPWSGLDNTMVVIVPLLAAIAGYAGLGNLLGGTKVAAALALSSAVAGAAASSLRKAAHVDEHYASGKAYFDVQQAAGALIGRLSHSTEADAIKRLDKLYKLEQRVRNDEGEPISTWRSLQEMKPGNYPTYRATLEMFFP